MTPEEQARCPFCHQDIREPSHWAVDHRRGFRNKVRIYALEIAMVATMSIYSLSMIAGMVLK